MFVWLYNALGTMLAWFESFLGTYALSLLFYALIFKVLFLPFSIKQQKNQIKLAKLTPKIELIKAKYRGRTDKPTMQKMQTEIMELQQKEGYSPLSGCLPLLIQLPLIMLLYAVIQNPLSYIASYNAITPNSDGVYEEVTDNDKISQIILELHNEYSEAEDVEKFKDVNQIALISTISNLPDAQKTEIQNKYGLQIDSIPNFNLWGVNLAATPSLKNFSILVLIPVLAAISSWLSMWLTRKLNGNNMNMQQDAQTQASMRIMDLVMPLMTLFIAFNFSGMLGLYWIYQSALGVGQSLILAKAMPLPKYTEEELKEMRKAQKAAEKAQKAAIKSQPKYKSLHYIDEDDYEELPVVKKNESQKTGSQKKTGGIDIPEIKD